MKDRGNNPNLQLSRAIYPTARAIWRTFALLGCWGQGYFLLQGLRPPNHKDEKLPGEVIFGLKAGSPDERDRKANKARRKQLLLLQSSLYDCGVFSSAGGCRARHS
jgi:hypothetical protein